MSGNKKDDVLTAVVIADAYNNSFNPITPASPHCLQLLAGRPLLDYTLEWLQHNGLCEVILYLSSGPGLVKSWLTSSRWSQQFSCRALKITTIVNEDSASLGDACRDLDEKGIVRGDFVLCHGDLVSNVKISDIMERHKARPKQDKHAIMSKVMISTVGSGDVTRCKGQEVVMATDKVTGQILFQQRSNLSSHSFPVELFQHEQVSVSLDMTDPDIYICSQAVLALFTEIFDKQDMDQLITETIESELIDYTLYLDVPSIGVAARASNPHLLLALNVIVLDRWVYPLVPHTAAYQHRLGGVYTGRGVTVDKGTVLEERVLVGEATSLGRGCHVSSASIGPRCSIAADVTVTNSVLGAGVVLGRGLTVSNCVIADGCHIPDGVSLGERVLIGPGVHLKPGVTVESGLRLTATPDEWGEPEGEPSLGPKAYVYTEEEEEDGDDDIAELRAFNDPWGEVYVTETDDSSDDESSDDQDAFDEAASSEDEQEDENKEHTDVKNFRKEVIESITRGIEQGVLKDNLVLEINGSKHAWNTNLSEVNQCVLFSVLTANVALDSPELTPQTLLAAVLKNINKLSQLLLHYSKSKSGQLYYLEGIQGIVTKHSIYMEIFPKILHTLYDEDILSDDIILTWHKELVAASSQDNNKAQMVSRLKPLISWLEQSDSESETDSD